METKPALDLVAANVAATFGESQRLETAKAIRTAIKTIPWWLRRIGRVFLFLLCICVANGCAYKGQLKSGFYKPNQNAPMIPLKAAVVIGPAFESGTFDTKAVYYSHSAQIRTHPALTQAMTDSCRSVFASVSVVQYVPTNSPDVEVLIVPSVEMRERVLTLSVALKSPINGDLIQQYQSSGNLAVRAPASVHVIGTINTVCMAALSPITAPTITHIIGRKAESELADRLSDCIHQVEEQMRNDPFLVQKLNAKRVLPAQ